jgi:hypothetical protein
VTFDPVEAHYFNEAGLRVEAMAEENAA